MARPQWIMAKALKDGEFSVTKVSVIKFIWRATIKLKTK